MIHKKKYDHADQGVSTAGHPVIRMRMCISVVIAFIFMRMISAGNGCEKSVLKKNICRKVYAHAYVHIYIYRRRVCDFFVLQFLHTLSKHDVEWTCDAPEKWIADLKPYKVQTYSTNNNDEYFTSIHFNSILWKVYSQESRFITHLVGWAKLIIH